MSKTLHTFSLKIMSPSADITLPTKIKNVNKMKIKQMRYITGSTGNEIMNVMITDFNNTWYYDGSKSVQYAASFFLSPDIGVPMLYDNYNNEFDSVNKTISELTNFKITVFINSILASDITSSNPLYLTITLEGDLIENKVIYSSLDDKENQVKAVGAAV